MSGPLPANRLWPALWGCAFISALLLGLLAAVQAFGSTASTRTFVVFIVNVMLVLSMQVFIGNSGIVSFGHVAFMGIGAYTTAILSISPLLRSAQLPALPAVLRSTELGLIPVVVASALVALVVAAIFGGGMIRMTESTMAMATLALLVVVHTFLQNATTFTRGSLGLAAIPVRTTAAVGTVAAIVFLLMGRLYKESGPGLRLRASREDPTSAAALGTYVVRARYGSWLLSAAMMGAAGSFWAQSVIAFNANQFYFAITFALLAMLVIGGRTSMSGAVAGAAIITFLSDTLARVEQGVRVGPWTLPRISGTVQFAIALLIIITLILRPEGLFDRWEIDDLLRRLVPARARRARPETELPVTTSPTDIARPSAQDETPILRGTGVEKNFVGVLALAGVDIVVERGEILGLIGPNGSGKTTLLNVISGISHPTGGQIELDGREIAGLKAHRVAEMGLSRTFQNIRLFSQLTVRENVEAAARPGTNPADVGSVLASLGLVDVEREKAVNLPYGMQRRLEIARAVIRRPSLILLDEPAAGMNESESDGLLENIRRIRSELDCSVVVVEHDLRLIMKLCDRIQVLDQGRTIGTGEPTQIARDPVVVRAYLGGPSTKSA